MATHPFYQAASRSEGDFMHCENLIRTTIQLQGLRVASVARDASDFVVEVVGPRCIIRHAPIQPYLL